jgi:penicillin-binding protein 1A
MARRDNLRRGSRRASAPPPQKRRPSPPQSGWRLWARRVLIWGGGAALVGALVLGLAVAFTARSLPSY